jgi:putative nucleotidyltransferase with HDIG domain
MNVQIKNRIEQIISNLDQLPSLPNIVSKIINMVQDPNVDFKLIANEIAKDQSVTTNILKLCNSAYFSKGKEIASLDRAIVTLGIKEVKDIVVVATTKQVLNKPVSGYDLEKGDLWIHNLAVAMLAKKIALYKKQRNVSDIVFTGGIIHDVGKTVLSLFVAHTFKQILAHAEEKQIIFQQAEQEIMGFDHQEIGEKILAKWDFPDVLKAIVRYHHIPEEAPKEFQLPVAVVHVANSICVMAGVGIGSDGLYQELNPAAVSLIGLSNNELENFYATLPELLKQAKSIM